MSRGTDEPSRRRRRLLRLLFPVSAPHGRRRELLRLGIGLAAERAGLGFVSKGGEERR